MARKVDDIFEAIKYAISNDYQKWPKFFTAAIESGRKFGYNSSKYDTISRHQALAFLAHNGASPLDIVEWLHRSNRVSTDALSELAHTLTFISRGEYRKHVWCMRNANKPRKRQVCLSFTSQQDVPAALRYLQRHKTAGEDEPLLPFMEARSRYFTQIFPFKAISQLIHRVGSPFQLREITAGKKSPLFRSQPILALSKLRWAASKRMTSLHAGIAHSETDQSEIVSGKTSLGTELVLEIDDLPVELKDCADEVRWRWLKGAVTRLLDHLKAVFQIRNYLIFASGNKSPHIWLLDSFIFDQTATERANFLTKIEKIPSNLLDYDMAPFFTPFEEGGLGLDSEHPRSTDATAELLWPQVDMAVACGLRHTHRLPFALHDSTDRVALPCTLATFPTSTECAPRVDDPELVSKLQPSLALLDDLVASLRAEGLLLPPEGVEVEIAPNPTSAWAITALSKKQSKTDLTFVPEVLRTLPELYINLKAVTSWANTIKLARTAVCAGSTPDAFKDDRLISLLSKCEPPGKDAWTTRLGHELSRLNVLLCDNASKLSNVVVENDAGGRLTTWHPEVRQKSFFKTLHGVTRHIITDDRLLELDISAAHPAAAFGAVVAMMGGDVDRARLKVPNLALLVLDRAAAIEAVRSEYADGYKPDTAKAKTTLLRSLNQSRNDTMHSKRKPFLKQLIEERETMEQALLQFEPLQHVVGAIQAKCADSAKDTTLLSLLMQAAENVIIESSIEPLSEAGWDTVAVISDAVLLDRQDAGADAEEARAVMEATAQKLGMRVVVKIDHLPVTGGFEPGGFEPRGVEHMDASAAKSARKTCSAIKDLYSKPGDRDLCFEINLDDFRHLSINPNAEDGQLLLRSMAGTTARILTSILGVQSTVVLTTELPTVLHLYVLDKDWNALSDAEVHARLRQYFISTITLTGLVAPKATTSSLPADTLNRPEFDDVYKRHTVSFLTTLGLKPAADNGLGLLDTAFDREEFAKNIDPEMWLVCEKQLRSAPSGREAYDVIRMHVQGKPRLESALKQAVITMLWPRLQLCRRRNGRGLAGALFSASGTHNLHPNLFRSLPNTNHIAYFRLLIQDAQKVPKMVQNYSMDSMADGASTASASSASSASSTASPTASASICAADANMSEKALGKRKAPPDPDP